MRTNYKLALSTFLLNMNGNWRPCHFHVLNILLIVVWGLNEKGWEYFMKKKAFRCFQTLKRLQICNFGLSVDYSNDI
jgi:hypothetical protein